MCKIVMNEEKRGVELYFDSKPDRNVLDTIKAAGFRWSNNKKMWYAKETKERLEIAASLSDATIETELEGNTKESVFDLWKMTRTEKLTNIWEEKRITNAVEIAKICRKHIKARFPMVKFSIRSNYNSISLEIEKAPFMYDSKELDAIIDYCKEYINQYNYDNSDLMTDYFDVNFYLHISRSYNYIQEGNAPEISELFNKKMDSYEKEKEEEEEKEILLRIEKMEKAEEERKKLEEIRKKNHDTICNDVKIVDIQEKYFIRNLLENGSKFCTLEEYDSFMEEYPDYTRKTDACISREVHFNREIYNLFCNQLLYDFDFISGFGGSSTTDSRINDMMDYNKMSSSERDTVKFYSDNCIAVYCENELKFVIDPQGYSYSRYCFMICEETKKEYEEKTEISPEIQELKEKAGILEDISSDIIKYNNLVGIWNKEGIESYLSFMKEELYKLSFDLSRDVIQQITDLELKRVMYILRERINSIIEKFSRATIKSGQKITVCTISDFGTVSVSHCKFESMEFSNYAQYDDNVKMIVKPERKRGLYYKNYHSSVIIINGYVDIPDEVLYEVSENSGFICKKSKYLSCDSRYLDDIVSYAKSKEMDIIVDYRKER